MISSLSNARIKAVIGLRHRKARKVKGLFLVEGSREIGRAIHSNFELDCLYVSKEILSGEGEALLTHVGSKIQEVSQAVFSKMAIREDTDGLIAVFKVKTKRLSELSLGGNDFVLVLDRIEKPGNLGAILRTADGVGAKGVLLVDGIVDHFNPNVVRASVGAVFSVPVFNCTFDEFQLWKDAAKVNILCASPEAENVVFDHDISGPAALVVGNEAEGLGSRWKEKDTGALVKLPMKGIGDSLNVSVACGILAYEVLRQLR